MLNQSQLSKIIGQQIQHQVARLRRQGASVLINADIPVVKIRNVKALYLFRSRKAKALIQDACRLSDEYGLSLEDMVLYQTETYLPENSPASGFHYQRRLTVEDAALLDAVTLFGARLHYAEVIDQSSLGETLVQLSEVEDAMASIDVIDARLDQCQRLAS